MRSDHAQTITPPQARSAIDARRSGTVRYPAPRLRSHTSALCRPAQSLGAHRQELGTRHLHDSVGRVQSSALDQPRRHRATGLERLVLPARFALVAGRPPLRSGETVSPALDIRRNSVSSGNGGKTSVSCGHASTASTRQTGIEAGKHRNPAGINGYAVERRPGTRCVVNPQQFPSAYSLAKMTWPSKTEGFLSGFPKNTISFEIKGICGKFPPCYLGGAIPDSGRQTDFGGGCSAEVQLQYTPSLREMQAEFAQQGSPNRLQGAKWPRPMPSSTPANQGRHNAPYRPSNAVRCPRDRSGRKPSTAKTGNIRKGGVRILT